MKKYLFPLVSSLAALVSVTTASTEYFVAKNGDDANTGIAADSPFLTIARGLKAIEAGDTLTIGPGEYPESNSARYDTIPGITTTIRAAIPGTVLIRGDRPVGDFEKVPGERFVWRTDWDQPVETINERDSLKMYTRSVTRAGMDNKRGVWFLDPQEKKLYIVTSNAAAPETHHLTVTVDRNFGLLIQGKNRNLDDFVVDGLTFTGFNCSEEGGVPGHHGRWGLYLLGAKNCVVRRCRAYFNGGGLGMARAEDTVIEDCVAYANGSQFCGSGGNIVIFGSAYRSTIRRCVAFSSTHAGIRFYGGELVDCLIDECVAWDNGVGDSWIKGNYRDSWTKNTVVLGGMHSSLTENTIYRYNGYSEDDPTSLKLANNRLPLEENFADPSRMDYRPMSDSKISGGLKDRSDVFFVSPDGDDSNKGDTIRAPRKTLSNLQPHSTVYLLPGEYEGGQVINAAGVKLRTHGNGPAAVFRNGKFGLEIAAKGVELDSLSFAGFEEACVKIVADNARITSCGFAEAPTGVISGQCDGLALEHNAFAESLETTFVLENCTGVVRDNLFSSPQSTAHSDLFFWNNHRSGAAQIANEAVEENTEAQIVPQYADPGAGDFNLANAGDFAGRGSDAMPLGPYRLIKGKLPIKVVGPFVASVTATTANIEWWTDSENATSELSWGETEKCENKAGNAYSGGCYHTVSLAGLQPGKKYFFRVNAKSPPFEMHSNLELEAADKLRERATIISEVVSFTTASSDTPGKEYFVAKNGDDKAEGTKEQPWLTIARGVRDLLAGDTLTIREGVYQEEVHLRSGGDAGKPITIRGAEGEKVWLDGQEQQLTRFFNVNNLNHIGFDNLYARNLGTTAGAAFIINGGHDIKLNRIFYDGRAYNYAPPIISARFCERLIMRNSFFTRGFSGARFFRCPDLRVENCVAYINSISQISITNQADEPAYVSRNIIFDSTLQKIRVPLVALWHLESIVDDRNCFFTRLPDNTRSLYGFLRKDGELLPKDARGTLNLEELNALPNGGEPSFEANPQIPLIEELISFPDLETWEETWKSLGGEHREKEYKRTKDGYAPFDFKDFIPANPLCRPGTGGKPVGFDLSIN